MNETLDKLAIRTVPDMIQLGNRNASDESKTGAELAAMAVHIYIDYRNNYLTVDYMAEMYHIAPLAMHDLIEHGRKIMASVYQLRDSINKGDFNRFS